MLCLPPATLAHMPEQHCALLGCHTGCFHCFICHQEQNTDTHAMALHGVPLSTGLQANAQPDDPKGGLLRASKQPTCCFFFLPPATLSNTVHWLLGCAFADFLVTPERLDRPAQLRIGPADMQTESSRRIICVTINSPVSKFHSLSSITITIIITDPSIDQTTHTMH